MTTIRRRRATRRAAISLAAALVVLASGCSSGGNDSVDAGAASPLAEFLGQGDFYDDSDASQARIIVEERARQEVIAECMQAQGFEYNAQDPSQSISFDSDIEDYGSDEWVAKWGFGITTQYFSQSQVGPNLVGYDDAMMGDEGDFVDPNQEYLDSLTETERNAFYEALYGGEDSFPTFDESLSEEEMQAQMEDFQYVPQGCEGESYADDGSFGFYQEFQDELQAMEERMQADPRVAERAQKISSCVADKGLEYESMEKIYDSYYAEMEKLGNAVFGDFPELSEDEMAQMSEQELQDFFAPPELSEEAKATLGELQAEEIELASAVNECGGGFEAEYEQLADIRAEYEQEFLDANADALEQYRVG